MPFYVYILRTSADTLYIGQTNNLEKRLTQHRSKKTTGSKYLRSFSSFNLVYKEEYASRGEALKREYSLKCLTKKQKESLIMNSI